MRQHSRPSVASQSTTVDLLIVGGVVLLIAVLAMPSFEPFTPSGAMLLSAETTSTHSVRSVAPVEEEQ